MSFFPLLQLLSPEQPRWEWWLPVCTSKGLFYAKHQRIPHDAKKPAVTVPSALVQHQPIVL